MSSDTTHSQVRFGAGPGWPRVGQWLLRIGILVAILLTRLHSYLLFHSLVEVFSIGVAFSVFILAWNSDALVKNGYLLILGVGSLFVAVIDLLHTLAYKGMGVFPGNDANLATQLWLAARYVQALTWLIAPFGLRRTIGRQVTALSYAGATALLLLWIFGWNAFPAAYMEGTGLTPFKIVSEYVIIAGLAVAAGLLWWRRADFDPTVLLWLVGSIAAGIASEFAFTLYMGVTDTANLAGHLLKIVEFYLLYRALVETGFAQPYRLLFRHMKEEQEARVERHRTRADARDAELDAIFSSMTDGVFLYSPDGAIQRMNDAARRIFAFSSASEDEPLARRARLHSFIDEDGRPVDNLREMPVPRALSGEEIHDMVLGIPNALTGDILWLASSAAPVRDLAGQVVGAVLTARDVTERRLAEEKIRQLNQELERLVTLRTGELEAANQETEAFVAAVSGGLHDPLGDIRTLLDSLLDNDALPLDDEARHSLEGIAGSAGRIEGVIEGLLEYSCLGRTDMTRSPVDLARLAHEVARELAPRVGGRHVTWDIGPLPTVTGDPALLHRVFCDLISNALKFTASRQAAVIEIGTLPGDSAEAVLFVRDNGIGFDMAHASRLFGVLERLHPAGEYEGVGLGLAAVRRIISRHGGRTWAEAEAGRGATFYFSLPAV